MESGLIFNQTHDRGFTSCVMSNTSEAFMFEVCIMDDVSGLCNSGILVTII